MGLWYNTDLVSPEEIEAINDPWDILQDRWIGKFVSFDPTQGSGGGGNLLDAWRDPRMGEDWLRAYWLGMEPFITGDETIIQSSLVKGAYHWGYATGVNDGFRALKALGAPVSDEFPRRIVFFNELTGGGSRGGMSILENPPHPNATTLYVNWFLSQEGQTYMQSKLRDPLRPNRGAIVSLREDVPPGLTLPERRRQPGVVSEWEPDLNEEQIQVRFDAIAWLGNLLAEEGLRVRAPEISTFPLLTGTQELVTLAPEVPEVRSSAS